LSKFLAHPFAVQTLVETLRNAEVVKRQEDADKNGDKSTVTL